MSNSIGLSGRTLQPEEVQIVSSVVRRITAQGHLSKSQDVQQAFAEYVMTMFLCGMTAEEKLYEICLKAARTRFAVDKLERAKSGDIHLPVCKVLILEDDYL